MNSTTLRTLVLLLAESWSLAQQPGLPGGARGSAADLGRGLEPQNPWLAGGGAATEHNDAESSNVTRFAGPGRGAVRISVAQLGALCPTVVIDSNGYVFAYCVNITDRRGSLRMLTPNMLSVLASLDMPATGRLGGFYMYLDAQDRIVLGSGNNHLLRISHSADAAGPWHLRIDRDWDLTGAVEGHCGAPGCDYLESVMPDWSGRIWFSSEGGVVGDVDPETGTARSEMLPAGEHVANSISSSPDGVAVASDHALYLYRNGTDGQPIVQWREAYDRGSSLKPDQLSQGTGATPVFFGRQGHLYLAITDNADSQENLLVYRVASSLGQGRLVCKVPLFAPGASAAENGPIGIGDSVVVSNTFGYDYRNFTGRGVRSVPGGLTRVDVRPDGSGCNTVWTNPTPSAAVPKLSAQDGIIYTVARTLTGSAPQYSFTEIDFHTGATLKQTWIGDSYTLDTYQLAGSIGPGAVLYQPTLSGIVQARPETGAH